MPAPVRVHGNTYLVGFEGLTVALIRTGEGLILVDGALPQAVPAIDGRASLCSDPRSKTRAWQHAGVLRA